MDGYSAHLLYWFISHKSRHDIVALPDTRSVVGGDDMKETRTTHGTDRPTRLTDPLTDM